MMSTLRDPLLCLFLFFVLACQRPYLPPVVSSDHKYLVVEGVVDSGDDTTTIKLSRSVRLDQKSNNPETGALVTIENEQDHKYFLTETAPGTYTVAHLNLPADANTACIFLQLKIKNMHQILLKIKQRPG